MPRLNTIVVGVDFSESSRAALAWVADSFAPDAEFVVVQAVDLPVPPPFLGESHDQQVIARELHDAVVRRLDGLAAELAPLRLRTIAPTGRPSDVIASVAAAEKADLIVVGPHGEAAGVREILGSTAERVLTHAKLPVLVAAGRPSGPPKRILAALENAESAERILDWSGFLADRFGGDVSAFHCLDRRLFGRIPTGAENAAADELERRAAHEARLWLESTLSDHGLPTDPDRLHVTQGATDKTLSELTCGGFDLVILGSHGAGTAERILVGSVAHKVIRQTCVPVLMVPPVE